MKVETPDVRTAPKLTARIWLDNPQGVAQSGTLTAHLKGASGKVIATTTANATAEISLTMDAAGVTLWSLETPALCTLDLTLSTAGWP